ncbi:unnamed protein product [Aphanomyces euteiches]
MVETTLTAATASALLKEIEASQRTFVSGSLVPSKDGASGDLRASLVWKDRDLVNGLNLLTQTQHVLHGENTVLSTLPSAYPSQYVSHSPSHKWFVVVTDTDDKPTSQFAFYNHDRLVYVHRTPKDLHGGLYTGPMEGGMTWSEDESAIYYLAEQKEVEGKSFWPNANKPNDKDENKSAVGAQYDLKEDWGEQYVGKRTSRIFKMEIASGKCAEVEGIPETFACSEVAAIPGSSTILFTAIDTKDLRRLGLIYCFNRPKHIYSLDVSTKEPPVRLPSQVPGTTRSARVSPDGKLIAYLGTNDVVTHNTCSMLCVLDWSTKTERQVIPVVREPSLDYTAHPETAFNGLYMVSLLRNCWTKDSKSILFNTDVGVRSVWKAVDVATGKIHSPAYGSSRPLGSETLVDVNGSHALVSVTTPQSPVSIEWIQWSEDFQVTSRVAVVTQEPSQHTQSWVVESIPVKDSTAERISALGHSAAPLVSQVSSKSNYEATLLLPSVQAPAGGFPVVMDLHGGPHGSSPATFRSFYTYLNALGFAVVSVNYRGSTGYGLDPLESLIGRVGTQDVNDCQNALLLILDKYADRLNRHRVHVSGGSHGGFLGSHLIGQFPSFYRSAVLRNPVTNLTSLVHTSDIPDWTCAVAGVAAFESIGHRALPDKRSAVLARFWDVSPMSNDLTKITTPLLLGIGGKDRRVPPTEGLQLFHSLRHHGQCEVQVKWYPDDCHPLDSVKTYSDFAVHWALWFASHDSQE